jgi:hypothetical protein
MEDEMQEQSQVGPEVATRRTLLGRFCGLSGGLFAGIASLGSGNVSAANFACCTLRYPPGSNEGPWCHSNGYGTFYCTLPGYSKKIWYCCGGNTIWGCGECTQAPDCNHGPWECSYGWNTNAPC